MSLTETCFYSQLYGTPFCILVRSGQLSSVPEVSESTITGMRCLPHLQNNPIRVSWKWNSKIETGPERLIYKGFTKLGLHRTGHMIFLTGQDRTGPDRTGQDRIGPDRTGHPYLLDRSFKTRINPDISSNILHTKYEYKIRSRDTNWVLKVLN